MIIIIWLFVIIQVWLAIYNKSNNIFLSPDVDGPIEFTGSLNDDKNLNIKNVSKFGRDFSIVQVPYCFKLLMQELQVMNVQMRIITEDNIDKIEQLAYSKQIKNINNLKPVSIIENQVKKLKKKDEEEPEEEVLEEMNLKRRKNLKKKKKNLKKNLKKNKVKKNLKKKRKKLKKK